MAAEDERQGGYLQQAGAAVRAGYNAVMRGGEIQAAFRQGFNELGAALKAFPDSLQVDEPGAVFNPLYRDIPSETKAELPSPGDIAEGNSTSPVQGETLQASRQDVPSPGQIAEGQGQQPVQGHGHDHGRGGGVYGPEHGVYGSEHGVYGPEKGIYGRDNAAAGPTPGEIADGRGQDGPFGRGVEVAQAGPTPMPQPEPGGFVEKIINERKGDQDGNDQGSLERGRVLPDEQMERDKGRGR
jgi:hypothetical protein